MPEISRFFGIIIRMYYIDLHAEELHVDWELALARRELNRIAPLD